MRSIQTQTTFDLSSVKPLERVAAYRSQCLAATRKALGKEAKRRERSPATGGRLEEAGQVDGLRYSRCADTGSLFLLEMPGREAWSALLKEVSSSRRSPEAFHLDLAHSRVENVHRPKLEWVQETLRLQGLDRPRALEAVTPPSEIGPLLRDSGFLEDVLTLDEMELARGTAPGGGPPRQAAFLFESLDRVDDPEGLLGGVAARMEKDGLLFVTALAASGFDMAVLGLRNVYLYPPDRANCFTLRGLKVLLDRTGFAPVEISTPGVLDVQIVREHLRLDPAVELAPFERQLLAASPEAQSAFQSYLQEWGLSSFARIAAKKR